MLFFTDPLRVTCPAAVAARLPRGCGVVFRAFGAPDALQQGRRLAQVCRRRGLVLLAGADAGLAVRIRAQGVHLPERLIGRSGDVRALRRRFLITGAVHSLPAALCAQRSAVDAVVVSPVFPSNSPSAGRPLGVFALARVAHGVRTSAYALGGINLRTVSALGLTGVIGFAAVEALAESQNLKTVSRRTRGAGSCG